MRESQLYVLVSGTVYRWLFYTGNPNTRKHTTYLPQTTVPDPCDTFLRIIPVTQKRALCHGYDPEKCTDQRSTEVISKHTPYLPQTTV